MFYMLVVAVKSERSGKCGFQPRPFAGAHPTDLEELTCGKD